MVRVFYYGLESKDESTFKFKMRKSTYMVTEDLWEELFDIIVVRRDPTLTDLVLYKNFDWKNNVNSILKTSRMDGNLDKLSTSYLKRDSRILN